MISHLETPSATSGTLSPQFRVSIQRKPQRIPTKRHRGAALEINSPHPPTYPPTDFFGGLRCDFHERHGDEGLIPLDLALLHSPSITDGWNSFLGAIRTKTSISADIRKLAICRVAVLNGAYFEWTQHSPLASAVDISKEGLKTIRDGTPGDLNEKQTAVLEFTTASTKDCRVTDLVFEDLKKHFSDKEIVEIIATVAAYNRVSRFLIALDVAKGNGVNVADYPMP